MNNYSEITNNVIDIINKKNADYGNAFEQSFNKYGWTAYLLRIQDKINRLETLTIKNNQPQVVDERIEDTLNDILGYTLLMATIQNKRRDKDGRN